MSQPSQKSERLTAIVSTLVAVAILAAGVTAQQSHQNPQDQLARLQSDLEFQLQRAYKHDVKRRNKRLDQLANVIQDWQHSTQSPPDHQRLVNWLTQATRNSMPGSSQSFPPAPEFSRKQSQAKSWIKDITPPVIVESENSQTVLNPFITAEAVTPDAIETPS
jgi:hypothetical protein